ncbi:MAG: hypothetical protein SA339_08315 [Methanomassiliicoccus sp.]|nr:hypothetical protein [Methanomassiliicoccus sp.]
MSSAMSLLGSSKLLIVLLVLGAIFSWVGLAFFGVAILSAAIIGALIGIFIPAILILVAFLVLIGIVPTPGWQMRMIISIGLIIVAWIISKGII